jgi:hypothetical protein
MVVSSLLAKFFDVRSLAGEVSFVHAYGFFSVFLRAVFVYDKQSNLKNARESALI